MNGPNGPYVPGPIFGENSPFRDGPPDGGPPPRPLGINISTEETMTGRLMFGVGVNSDAGLVGRSSWTSRTSIGRDFPPVGKTSATARPGAAPASDSESRPCRARKCNATSVSFQEPYMFGTQVSMALSGYYYNRIYTEYTDQRLGGRIGFGYQFTPDSSAGVAYRGAKINITNPIDPLLPDLAEVVGRNLALHGFRLSLSDDKRDNAFLATEGHLIEASIRRGLGLVPISAGGARPAEVLHPLRAARRLGPARAEPVGPRRLARATTRRSTSATTPAVSRRSAASQFRGASPPEIDPITGDNMVVGGDFQLLASVEYLFPITADDMLRGVVFCDTRHGRADDQRLDRTATAWRPASACGFACRRWARPRSPWTSPSRSPGSPATSGEMFSFFVGFER